MSFTPNNKSAYVIMPFSATQSCSEQQWTDIFTEVFVPAFQECGYNCQRATPVTGSLIKSIITELRNAWIVLADLTDRHANVYYELGVRHSLSKRTILIAQDSAHIPSDLRGYWWFVYGTQLREVAAFRKKIAELVAMIEADPERSDSPVSDFLLTEQFGVTTYLVKECIKKLSGLFTELTGIVNTLDRIKEDWRYSKFFDPICLDALLSTRYVDVGPLVLEKCYELRHDIRTIQIGLSQEGALADRAKSIAKILVKQIDDIRAKLTRGEFIEPSEVSVMGWSPIATNQTSGTQEASNWRYSTPADLSKINLDDFRQDIDNAKLT